MAPLDHNRPKFKRSRVPSEPPHISTSPVPRVADLTVADQGDVIVYRLPGPDDGGIEPRQQPVRSATGMSWVGQHTDNSSFITRTSTMSVLTMFSL